MSHAESKSRPRSESAASPEAAGREVPTFIATDLMEKLIADRDARAVDRVVMTAVKRH